MDLRAKKPFVLHLAILGMAVAGTHAAVPASDMTVYEGSLNKPGLYGVCKQKDPGLATTYDQALQGWLARNRDPIERGRVAVLVDGQRTGIDKNNMLRDNVAWAVADFARQSRYAILTACEDMLARDRQPG